MRSVRTTTVFALLLCAAGFAWAEQPNFGPAIYGDGEVWGTKGTTSLPAPNGHNEQSFDKLFMFVNGAPGQLAVSEAAPGNPAYNGGRWAAYTAMWTEAGMEALGDPLPVLMSYDEVMANVDLGYLAVAPGEAYFQCPLLPVH